MKKGIAWMVCICFGVFRVTGQLALSAPDSSTEDEVTKAIIDHLESTALEVESTTSKAALAWTLTKNAFPVVGARKVAQRYDSLKALDICLTLDQLEHLESFSAITIGYSHDLLKTVQKTF